LDKQNLNIAHFEDQRGTL